MSQTQPVVFDSFYLPFVIASNTTGMSHLKIKDESHRLHHSVSDYAIFSWRNSPLLIIDASRSHTDTPHLVGLLWTSDRPQAQTST